MLQPADPQTFSDFQRQQIWLKHAGAATEPVAPIYFDCTTSAYFDSDDQAVRDKPLSFHWRIDIAQLRRDLPSFPLFKNKKIERAAAAIVADAIQVIRSATPHRRICYSRSHDWYSERGRYNGSDFTYTTVVQAVDALVDVGILTDHDKRRPVVGGSGIQSSFGCAAKLIEVRTHEISRAKLDEVLVLKDEQKHRTGYKDTVRTRRTRRDINKINEFIVAADITLDAPHAVIEGDVARFGNHSVYLSMNECYRVFNNGKWSDGGRVYGTWWQQMRSCDRQHIRIDGKKVIELDYGQLHPRLMYAKVGVQYEGDAYAIPGWTNSKVERDKCKRGWNVLLNSKSWPKAVMAMTRHTDGCRVTARELLGAIRSHHPKISHQFYSGAGLKLQAIDGDMCMEILKEMIGKHGIVCLSVHDSFIVADEYREILDKVMCKALEKGLSRVSGKPYAEGDLG